MTLRALLAAAPPRRQAPGPAPAISVAVFVVVSLLPAAARAEPPPVRLELRESHRLPFTPAELQSLVGARMRLVSGADSRAIAVLVGPIEGGQIEVVSPLRRQRVLASDQGAADAARLVALAVVDVARDPLASAPMLATEPATTRAARSAGGATPSPAPPLLGPRLLLLAGSSFGLAGQGGSLEPGLVLEYTTRSPWSLGGSPLGWGVGLALGYSRARARIDQQDFRFESWPLRLGPRLGWRWLQASAGPVLRLYRTAGLDGGRGSIAGGFLGLRAGVPLVGGFRGVLALACDAYTERLEFRARQLALVRTHYLIPWLGLGLEWGRSS